MSASQIDPVNVFHDQDASALHTFPCNSFNATPSGYSQSTPVDSSFILQSQPISPLNPQVDQVPVYGSLHVSRDTISDPNSLDPSTRIPNHETTPVVVTVENRGTVSPQSIVVRSSINHNTSNQVPTLAVACNTSSDMMPETTSLIQKFDTACSKCVSGCQGRLIQIFPALENHKTPTIQGFNGSVSKVAVTGLNVDFKEEFYVPDMPADLCLLCARDYAKDGAAILYANDGVVLSLDAQQLETLKRLVDTFPKTKQLRVNNNTYEVDETYENSYLAQHFTNYAYATNNLSLDEASELTATIRMYNRPMSHNDDDDHRSMPQVIPPDGSTMKCDTVESDNADHIAFRTKSTNYFVSRVNVTTVEELILAYLLSGLTIPMLRTYLEKPDLLSGLDPSLTMSALNKFERKYGVTPDVLSLAYPYPYSGKRGYLSNPVPITAVGQNVQADFFETDYTEADSLPPSSATTQHAPGVVPKARRTKIHAMGGAKYGFLAVDKYTKFLCMTLTKSTDNTLPLLQSLVGVYRKHGHSIKLLSADYGVLPNRIFRVLESDAHAYLHSEGINTRQSEPYHHENGTADIERSILAIKTQITKAILYLLNNPNFPYLGFSRRQIYALWGELAHWAVIILNLAECAKVPGKTRYEAFTGVKPNVQDFRILPIFSVLLVQRHAATAERTPDGTNRNYWQRGLYLGPDLEMKGAIRVAVLATPPNCRVLVLRTTHFKQVTDGGHVNIYPHVNNGMNHLLNLGNEEHQQLRHPDDDSSNAIPSSAAPAVSEHMATDSGDDKEQEILSPPTRQVHDQTQANMIPITTNNPTPSTAAVGRQRNQQRQSKRKGQVHHQTNTMSSSTHSDSHQQNPVHDSVIDQQQQQPSKAIVNKRPRHAYTDQIAEILSRMRRPNKRYAALMANFHEDSHAINTEETTTFNNDADIQKLHQLYAACSVKIVQPDDADDQPVEVLEDDGYIAHDPLEPFDCLHVSAFSSTSFTDWSTHKEEDYYVDALGSVVQVSTDEGIPKESPPAGDEICYRAVKGDVPKTFQLALKDPLWGEAARTEWHTILEQGTLLKIDRELAHELIRDGADMVVLFPIYEKKIKEGKEVFKVRLVANGKSHHPEDSPYSPTPRKEELFILLHLAACQGWQINHIDEMRAFLSATYKDKKTVITRHTHGGDYYKVIKALYGLKTSPKDYQTDVADRLITSMGFQRIPMCTCIYIKIFKEDNTTLIIYDYVDDFVCTGSAHQEFITQHYINPFRGLAKTTEPVWDPSLLLGMEIVRLKDQGLICLTMKQRIADLVKVAFPTDNNDLKRKTIPIPPSKYLVYDEQFALLPASQQTVLNAAGQKLYMKIIGALIWISGVRHDIVFPTTYLSWFTQHPIEFQLYLARHLVQYLHTTINMPLVLGGPPLVEPVAFSDSSLAQGPKRRSINGGLVKMHPKSGAIQATAKATVGNRLNTFEAELDAATNGFKELSYLRHILQVINYPLSSDPLNLYADNAAMINFVKGEGTATGVRYMDIRLWFTRELYQKNEITINYMSGTTIPANLLTKLGNGSEHSQFCHDILGLNQLPIDIYTQIVPEDMQIPI